MSRLIALVMLFLSFGFAVVLTRFGFQPLVVAPGAVFGAAVAALVLSILIGVEDAVPLLAGAIVFGGLAVLLIVFDRSHGYDWITARELLVAVGAVELAAVLGAQAVRRIVGRRAR
jgi:hypothetical protein